MGAPSRALLALACGLWMGAGVGVLLGTRAVFRHARGTPLAGQIAADALASLSKLTWVVGLFAIGAALIARVRFAEAFVIAGYATFLLADLGVRRTLRKLRRDAGGTIESLPKDDSQRRKFGMLHGASMLLLLVQIVCAALALTALALAG